MISLLMGAGMGFVYDCIRCVRRLFFHNNVLIAIEDLIFWIVWAFIIIDKIHFYNYGSLRGYVLLGIFLGAVLYACTISCVFIFYMSHILCWVRKQLKKVKKVLKNGGKQGKMNPSISKKDGYGYGKKFKKKVN